MQIAGHFTLNAWAMDGFHDVFWRQESFVHALPECGVLLPRDDHLLLENVAVAPIEPVVRPDDWYDATSAVPEVPIVEPGIDSFALAFGLPAVMRAPDMP